MHPEQALQKLNELREFVDDDTEEMVDVLAKLMVLKQDISNPMYGAKVTYYDRPDGKWIEVDKEELPDSVQEQVEAGESYTDYSEVECPWRWRVTKMSGKNMKQEYLDDIGRSEDDVWFTMEKYVGLEEPEKVHRTEVPEPLDPDQPLEDDIEAAEELDGEWSIYEKDYREYRVRRHVEVDELVSRNGIVFEPSVSGAPYDEMWDPNKEEYRSPEDYPMGTVNIIIAENGEFGTDYCYGTEEVTSVCPCNGEPSPYSYTPGWD